MNGNEVGEHIGLMYYTLGQRRGLDIGGIKGMGDGRWFVVKKDLEKNILYVSHGDESPLYSKSCEVSGFNWIPQKRAGTFECMAKFRYRQPDQPVCVHVNPDGTLHIDFAQPQRAVTEGQYAVLYDGIIIETKLSIRYTPKNQILKHLIILLLLPVFLRM